METCELQALYCTLFYLALTVPSVEHSNSAGLFLNLLDLSSGDGDTHQFWQIHISEDSHDNSVLTICRIGPLCSSKGPENGQNVTESEVIVDLCKRKAMPLPSMDNELMKIVNYVNDWKDVTRKGQKMYWS